MGRRIGTTQARVSKFEVGRIPRLEPEQAKKAHEISSGVIKVEDCLFDTPHVLALKPMKKGVSK